MESNPHPLKNPEEYWSKVWARWRHDDSKKYIKAMADRANTKDYWDSKWTWKKRRVEKYSMQMAWYKIRESGAKSVLDVGCGNGRLLYGVNDICDCFGIDISEVAIKRMMREYRIPGAVMDIYDMGKLERTFDFVVINHTLEHLYRDEEVVRMCKDKLNPGGTFFAAVPNDLSGPEETAEHVRKYNRKMLEDLINKVFGNCEIIILHNHLMGLAKKI